MSDKISEVEAANNSILTGACRDGECWFNPETGYLEACPEHESQGMEAMMAKDAASKLAPLTEDAPKEIDWANDEAVVRAAIPGVYQRDASSVWMSEHSRNSWISSSVYKLREAEGYLGDFWKQARQHPIVAAYEREHNPAFKVSASPVGELDGAFESWRDKSAWACFLDNRSYSAGDRESSFEHVRKPHMPIRAVKWTGENLEEVRKVYPHLGEEYMRDKGCGLGHYVICPYPGRVYFQDAASFEETYTRAALTSKPAPEGTPERPQWGKLGAGVEAHLSTLEAIISAKDAEIAKAVAEKERADKLQAHFALLACQRWDKIDELTLAVASLQSSHRVAGEQMRRAEASEAELASLKIAYGLSLELHGCGGKDCAEASYLKDANEMMEELASLRASSAKVMYRVEQLVGQDDDSEWQRVIERAELELAMDYFKSTHRMRVVKVTTNESVIESHLSLLPTSPESQEAGQ